MKRTWETVYIGIGSNLSDRKANIEESMALLKAEEEINVLKMSSLYEIASSLLALLLHDKIIVRISEIIIIFLIIIFYAT